VFGAYGTGWGTVKPKNLDDDTDCTGSISAIRWQSWGGKTAHGTGFTCTANPQEGGTRVQIRLFPTDLGRCAGSKRMAYRKFVVQFPMPDGGWHPKQNWLGLKSFCKPVNEQV
jgi:hypothetical protein